MSDPDFGLDFSAPDFAPDDFSPSDFASRDFATTPDLGPPYPPSPVPPRQPVIGTFDVGLDLVGDVVPFSYWSTIISQYANSNILTTLIGNFQRYIDQTKNLEDLYDNIWNVLTAQDYGLDVWGRIVGVQRVILVQTGKFFGFHEQTEATIEPFGPGGVGPFYAGTAATSNYRLSVETFRTLILAKAMANISNGSIPSINAILLRLFHGRGNAYVTDGMNMTMTYTFKFPITHAEFAIISTSGVLPKPTGVASSIVFPGFIDAI